MGTIASLASPSWLEPTEASARPAKGHVHRDLDVDLIGAAIIADLLEQLERLEAELARWRRGSQGPTEDFRQP